MSQQRQRPDVVMPTAEEDRAITAAAKADPDAPPLTPAQLKAMVPAPSSDSDAGHHVAPDRG